MKTTYDIFGCEPGVGNKRAYRRMRLRRSADSTPAVPHAGGAR